MNLKITFLLINVTRESIYFNKQEKVSCKRNMILPLWIVLYIKQSKYNAKEEKANSIIFLLDRQNIINHLKTQTQVDQFNH